MTQKPIFVITLLAVLCYNKTMRKTLILSTLASVLIVIITAGVYEHPLFVKAQNKIGEVGLISDHYVVFNITDITKEDHIAGNPNGEVVLIEYSDLSCVFCALMRSVFDDLQNEYNNIRLVYRHFYPTKRAESIRLAVAAECVAEIGDDKTFFAYINKLYENQRTINEKFLVQYATELGLSINTMKECLKDEGGEKYKKIADQSDEIERLGARGTPYILLVKENTPLKSTYALPYENLLELLIEEFGGEALVVPN